MLSCLFVVALWSLDVKGLTTLALLCVIFIVALSLECGVLGQVWYFVVSIPDLCLLSYFDTLCGCNS